jgi:RNA recognition motif-containing protein
MFRQYAMVQNVSLLRDPQSNMSRGIAFVEFLSIDHATHTLNCYNQSLQTTSTSSQPLQVSYAKESFLKGLPALQLQQQQLHNVMVAPLPFSTQSNPNQTRSSSTTASGASSLDVQKAYARAALEAAQWSAGTTAPNANILSSSNAGTKQHPVALSYTTPSYFETHGASYIFQPKSGIFYDAATKFYYCPKSKLYYSEVDGRYLYAVSSDKKSGKNSPAAPPGLDFLEFVPPIPSSAPVENSIAVKQEVVIVLLLIYLVIFF